MILGFVGTKRYMGTAQRETVERMLVDPDVDELHHLGRRGADITAHNVFVTWRNERVVGYPTTDEECAFGDRAWYPPHRVATRSRLPVERQLEALVAAIDALVIVPASDRIGGLLGHVAGLAVEAGVHVAVVWPAGAVTPYEWELSSR